MPSRTESSLSVALQRMADSSTLAFVGLHFSLLWPLAEDRKDGILNGNLRECPEGGLRSAHPASITEGAILLLLRTEGVGGHEELWKGQGGGVPSVRRTEGKREHFLERAKVLTGICLLPPSCSHLFWRYVNVSVFPGDWPAGASLEFYKLAICHPIINDTYKRK